MAKHLILAEEYEAAKDIIENPKKIKIHGWILELKFT
jgi:hypothetical protein